MVLDITRVIDIIYQIYPFSQKSTNSANFVQYLEFQYQHQSELKSVYVLYFSEFSFIHQIDIIITVQKMYLSTFFGLKVLM